MENSDSFQFKKFKLSLSGAVHKVGTDSILLGSWAKPIGRNILDIGTGSGILALMMAQKTTTATITAIEIDTKSANCANRNFKNSPWANRLCCKTQNIVDFTKPMKHIYFSTIICNPPFFISGHKSPLSSRAIARHTVLLTPEALITSIMKLLDVKGTFFLILPLNEAMDFKQKAGVKGLYFNREVSVRSFTNRKVERVLLEFSKNSIFYEKSEIVLMERPLKYSNQYWEISKEFYLTQEMGMR